MAGRLDLGLAAARSLARVARDRAVEGFGRGLPRTPEELARVEVVNRLLAESWVEGFAPLPPVRSVRLPGTDFESSNCRNFLLEVDYVDEAAAESAPRTLYAKLPGFDLTTKVFAGASGFWDLECHFLRHVAAHVPIRVPRVHAVAQRGARFVMLLENLHEEPGTTLFLNRDMAAGTTPERARAVLTTFADLHAGFADWTPDRRETLLPKALSTFQAPRRAGMSRAMNEAAIEPCHRAAPDLFPREVADTYQRAIEKWDRLSDYWFREPLTLVHGDSHLGNVFEYQTPDGPQMGMLDFQGVHWSKGIRDVQYFLINSLDTRVLEKHEDALIDHYLAELGRRGVELAPDVAREQYRAFSLQTLGVGVVPLGLGGLAEREVVVRKILGRASAAVQRLGFREWLEAL